LCTGRHDTSPDQTAGRSSIEKRIGPKFLQVPINEIGKIPGTCSLVGGLDHEYLAPVFVRYLVEEKGLSFKSLVAGFTHSCGLTIDGAAWCWGDNGSGQLGTGAVDVVAHRSPEAVATSERFLQLSAGGKYTCGITVDHRALCWGANYTGQLGDGTTTLQPVPTAVSGGLRLSYIVATSGVINIGTQFGGGHTCALTESGEPWCWGFNAAGQVGVGTTTTQLLPAPVAGGLTLTSIAVGEQFTCGKRSGAVWCWGLNNNGQLGNGSLVNATSPVAVGSPFAAP